MLPERTDCRMIGPSSLFYKWYSISLMAKGPIIAASSGACISFAKRIATPIILSLAFPIKIARTEFCSSLAKNAATFFNISRSSVRRAFSFHKRFN